MSDVIFKAGANFSEVEKAFHKMAQQNVQLLTKLKKLQQTQNAAAKQNQAALRKDADLRRQAIAVMERHRTPLEKYRQELGKVRDMYDRNQISQRTFIAEKQRLLNVLQKETQSTKAVRGSHRQLNEELARQVKRLRELKIGSAEWQRQKQKVDALRASVRQANDAIGEQGEKHEKSESLLSSQIGKAKGLAAAYLGVQAVVQAITYELEKQAQIEREAAGHAQTLEESIALAMPNIVAEDRDRFRDVVREESLRLGVSQEDYAETAGIAISAGAGDLDRAAEILSELFTITAGNKEQAQALGGAALDFITLAGTDDVEGAIGQLAATMEKTRATDMASFATNIAPAIATATAGGENIEALTVERGLELGATISQLLKDTTGERTATALTQFVSRLDQFAPEVGDKQQTEAKLTEAEEALASLRQVVAEDSALRKGGEVTNAEKRRLAAAEEKVADLQAKLAGGGLEDVSLELVNKFQETQGFDARLELLRASPELADQFVDGLRQGKLKNALREMAIGTERAVSLDEEISVAIPSMDDARGNFESLKSNVIENTRILMAQRKAEAAEQYYATEGTTPIVGQARQIFEDSLKTVNLVGFDFLEEKMITAELEARKGVGQNPIEAMIDILQEERGTEGAFLGLMDGMKADDIAKLEKKVEQLEALNVLYKEAGGTGVEMPDFLRPTVLRKADKPNEEAAAVPVKVEAVDIPEQAEPQAAVDFEPFQFAGDPVFRPAGESNDEQQSSAAGELAATIEKRPEIVKEQSREIIQRESHIERTNNTIERPARDTSNPLGREAVGVLEQIRDQGAAAAMMSDQFGGFGGAARRYQTSGEGGF